MSKKILFILLTVCSLSCHKNQQQLACGVQVCTDLFASIGIHFTDKNGKAIAVNYYTVINQRTHLNLTRIPPTNEVLPVGYYIIADDNMRNQLSSEGDDILVTATNPATGQAKSVTFKLSGGCNCHVVEISGVDTVVFDK